MRTTPQRALTDGPDSRPRITEITDDPQNAALFLSWGKSAAFRFAPVPPTLYDQIVEASKRGQGAADVFFRSAIKGKYPFTRV